MTLPSNKHNNRRIYNYQLYNTIDKYLMSFSSKIKGKTYDLGCGNMHYKSFVTSLNGTYFGVDWDQSMHSTNPPDIICDLNETLPIDSDVADTIICISVIEHLKNPKLFVKEMRRILKPEGNLFLQVPFMWRVHEAPHDYSRFTPYALELMLIQAGFKSIEIHPQSGVGLSIALKINYFLLSLIRGPKTIRKLMTLSLSPIFIISQFFGLFIDRFFLRPDETIGFCVQVS